MKIKLLKNILKFYLLQKKEYKTLYNENVQLKMLLEKYNSYYKQQQQQ